MTPRWTPRWFAYVGLGPNPAFNSTLSNVYISEPKNCAEHTYVWLALYKNSIVVFKTKHGAEQWINSLDYPEGWAISCYQVFEDEE